MESTSTPPEIERIVCAATPPAQTPSTAPSSEQSPHSGISGGDVTVHNILTVMQILQDGANSAGVDLARPLVSQTAASQSVNAVQVLDRDPPAASDVAELQLELAKAWKPDRVRELQQQGECCGMMFSTSYLLER
jgi:hypothetical protein